MNDCANRKLLAHAHEKHQETLRDARMKHDKEISNLEDINTQLLTSLAGQDGMIHSLKNLSMDSAQTISSLTLLIEEKDRVRALQIYHVTIKSLCLLG